MRCGLLGLITLVVMGLIGCGSGNSTQTTAQSPAAGTAGGQAIAAEQAASEPVGISAIEAAKQPSVAVPATASPEQVVQTFLDALKQGDIATKASLLTQKAREETTKEAFEIKDRKSVDTNDKPFGTEFPYVVRPHGGFEHQHHRAKGAQQPTAPSASPEANAAAVTVELAELNDSGVSGTATLTTNADGTRVVIQANGATGAHPAHIHEGSCDDLNPNPAFPLADVDASGASDTVVPISLEGLTDGLFAINVHLSQEQIGTYVMCGNIAT